MVESNGSRPLIEVRDVRMYFPVTSGIVFQRKVAEVKAVDDVSITINKGEVLGLVGESGSGKTTLGRVILQLQRQTSGDVFYDGERLNTLSNKELRPIRRKMQVIFQDPYGSLNPRMTCGDIVGEPLSVHKLTQSKGEYQDRVAELLQTVGLNPFMADRYPHEFSGGQRQRIGIARALAVNPDFIVCDEPVSALDVSIQAQIINLLEELKEKLQLTYLFIAHDLSVVRHISDRVAVMYLGHIVEVASRQELYDNPLHPVHEGAPLRHSDPRPRHGGAARAHHPARRAAQSHVPARRLRLPHSLPRHGRGVQGRDAPAPRGQPQPLGRLHPRRRLRDRPDGVGDFFLLARTPALHSVFPFVPERDVQPQVRSP